MARTIKRKTHSVRRTQNKTKIIKKIAEKNPNPINGIITVLNAVVRS